MNGENTIQELFNRLESAVETSCNIPLEKTYIWRVLYFSNEVFELDDFKDKFSGLLRDVLFSAEDRRVKLLFKNLTIAIQTNCNNKINLDDVVVSSDWRHGCIVDSNIRSVKERYRDVTYFPDSEELFKKMWLKILIGKLKEVKEAIGHILNEDLITVPQLKTETSEIYENPYPDIFKSFDIYTKFIEYTSKHIIDFYRDYSYLKKRLDKEGLIHITKDNEFMRIVFEDMKLIKQKQYDDYVVRDKLLSLMKSTSTNRENNFNNIFD